MSEKIGVAVIFGGRSAEHEISLRSARSVLDHLDPDRFVAIPIGIDPNGGWHLAQGSGALLADGDPISPAEIDSVTAQESTGNPRQASVVFPVLHGPYGEDGTVQGLFELAGIPYVGSGVAASAIAMDKEIAKRLLTQSEIAVTPSLSFTDEHQAVHGFEETSERLGTDLFVKPANLGSSVGVSRISDRTSFVEAIRLAFRYDTKVVVESAIVGREIECGVMGNAEPSASLPGEIVTQESFYSYHSKYGADSDAEFRTPADLDRSTTERVRETAVRAFRALGCSGLARVDMFLNEAGELLVNEVNTMPGFTTISGFSKMWAATGIAYDELLTRLIDLAFDRHQRRSRLTTRYERVDESPAG